ncbi:hypothetical protein [Timonella sp. A28]|uniref:hypothetical protein n=1 Tax=Timonella sp. A28 TaxID=3442640 RepID=UPI003EB69BDA
MSYATGTFMRAALQTQYGEASTVHYGECAVPTADKNRVVVAVEAAALNPADVFAMRGKPFVMKLAGGLTKPRQPVRDTHAAVRKINDTGRDSDPEQWFAGAGWRRDS